MTDTIQNLREQVTKLKKKNDWLEIFNITKPITLPQNELLWKDHVLLNDIAYACAKLSETTIPRELFRDQKGKTKFLEQQAEYRKHTEQIRKRCIQLKPSHAGYRSNLAYTYYQNIIELTGPSGRKDGNIKKEIENFITAVDETLTLDPKRVTDLYRKGYILTKVYPKQILWNKSYGDKDDSPGKSKKFSEIREKGIQTLHRAINEWEKLNPLYPDEETLQKRYRKDYIKTLYRLSLTYYDKIVNHWDEAVFALNLRDDISNNEQVSINEDDKRNIDKAIQTIKKCCETDCQRNFSQDVKQYQPSIAAFSGVYEGVDKLYRTGTFFFAKYWILSGYGLKDTEAANKNLKYAEFYLKESLKCEWSPQKSNQDKAYIAERLARVFIIKGQYDQAISVIESSHEEKLKYKYNLESVPDYILNTWALAMLKSGRIVETQTILDIAKKSRKKTVLWHTYFLKGCAYLESDELELAQENLQRAHKEAERMGKKTVDSLLIAKAFVEYKSDNVSGALKLLKEAQRLNPRRVSTSERIHKWQQNDN